MTLDYHYTGVLEKMHGYLNRFLPLSMEEFKLLMPFYEIRKFDRNEKVINEGETDIYLNFIVQGLVRKYTVVGKKEVTLQLSVEGHLIHSEISFITQTPSDTIVEAIEPTVFVSISYNNLENVFKKYPVMERLGRHIITYIFIKKDQRAFFQLKKSTRERFLYYLKAHPDMLQRVPQRYIASYLNIKPETFSRLKHLTRQGNGKQ